MAVLITLLFLASSQLPFLDALLLPNFYPFGLDEDDHLLQPNGDEGYGNVSISVLSPFFDENHDSLFVSMAFCVAN